MNTEAACMACLCSIFQHQLAPYSRAVGVTGVGGIWAPILDFRSMIGKRGEYEHNLITCSIHDHDITMTLSWPRWRLKSPALRLFTQSFIQAQTKRKHQSSVSLAFVWGNSPGPVNSPHKGPVTRKMFPFDDVIMTIQRHKRPFIVTGLSYGFAENSFTTFEIQT